MHTHTWKHLGQQSSQRHVEGDKYVRIVFIEVCDCGVYRTKEYINEFDVAVAEE